MTRTASISVLLLCLVGASLAMIPRDFSRSMVDYINNLPGNTWKASYRHFGQPMFTGALKSDEKLPVMNYRADDIDLPDHFDAREQWPECPSIGMIRDQGSCGSCWAIAAAETISDRICIASKGQQQVLISPEDIVSCCQNFFSRGCDGGDIHLPWKDYNTKGLVSGGFYGSDFGCRPYTIPPCNHGYKPSKLPQCSPDDLPTPACEKKCREGYGVSYEEDKHFGGEVHKFKTEKNIMKDLMTNGPLEARFDVYEDFRAYDEGIYQHVIGKLLGSHAIKVIGWGEENGTKYWLLANSWNENWGENGFFRMVRGTNDCGIERDAIASIPVKSLKSSY